MANEQNNTKVDAATFIVQKLTKLQDASRGKEPYPEFHQDLGHLGFVMGNVFRKAELLREAIELMRRITTDTNPVQVMETYNKVSSFVAEHG